MLPRTSAFRLPPCPLPTRAARPVMVPILALGLIAALSAVASAQQWWGAGRTVGGIAIDAEGMLENATVDELGKLSRLRRGSLERIPDELNGVVELRKISLRRLEAAIQQCTENGKKLPDALKCLAGLQQIRYVFVYPKQKDIVLVGPGEGWKVDKRGNIVGITTGRPVMFLDDFLVALRTARQAANGGISCSIDPTAEGIARLHNLKLRKGSDPYQAAATMETLLGPQNISLTGVPPTSRFARVLVAADYRMKRLGMGLEPSPVPGLPSYLKMMKATGRGMSTLAPRWWLEPDYRPLLKSPDGLAWELRGASVKAMTEEDLLTATGNRRHTGRANPVAQKWADNMTKKYPELAIAEPIFGELRNCMELAIVAALVVKESLTEKAGYSMPILFDPADVKVGKFAAPKHNWVITASGGVQVNSWSIADRVQQSDAPARARTQATPGRKTNWWWN